MLPVFSAEQARQADALLMAQEPISSIDLMERAARGCADWLLRYFRQQERFLVLAGMGNNGGDGIAIARMLKEAGRQVRVDLIQHRQAPSPETGTNLERARALGVDVVEVDLGSLERVAPEDEVVIDALFGSGLDRPVTAALKELIRRLNKSASVIISIDMPSGLFCEDNSLNDPSAIVEADHVLTIGAPKLALLLPENERCTGQWHAIPIGYDRLTTIPQRARWGITEVNDLHDLLPPRSRFMHKGRAGHALLIAGARGKMGAAVLAARACARSGVGLVSLFAHSGVSDELHLAIPECMLAGDRDTNGNVRLGDISHFDSVAIGPGIGMSAEAVGLVKVAIQSTAAPMVLDADALNILADNPTWQAFLPPGSILTPHPKEFDRLAGNSACGHDRLMKAIAMARRHGIILLLKGAYTAVCHPDGNVRFNPTGGPGMAKGGSGDSLTGILAALLAQGVDPFSAAVLGAYVHGEAGDLAAEDLGMDGMLPSDLIERLPLVWKRIRGH